MGNKNSTLKKKLSALWKVGICSCLGVICEIVLMFAPGGQLLGQFISGGISGIDNTIK